MKFRILTVMAITLFTVASACKSNSEGLDCDLVGGTSWISNGGQVQNILETRCGISGCHAPGGFGTSEWTYNDEYDSLTHMFDRMYEQAITLGNMPPDTATQLTSDQKDIFECWKQAGFPE